MKGLDGLESELPSYHGHSTQMHSDALSTLTCKKIPAGPSPTSCVENDPSDLGHGSPRYPRALAWLLLVMVAAMSFQVIYVIVNPQ